MDFSFRVTPKNVAVQQVQGLFEVKTEKSCLFYCGLEESTAQGLLTAYEKGETTTALDALQNNHFFVFLYNRQSGDCIAANDKFGNNEIYLHKEKDAVYISSTIPVLSKKEIHIQAAYEFLALHTICAPKTIFKDVEIVPIAHVVQIDAQTLTYAFSRYWNIESLFVPKSNSYEALVDGVRHAFYKAIAAEYEKDATISTLSGGIDSGGILGILTDYAKGPVASLSFGPQGKYSYDLESARKTVEYNKSLNTEVYPSQQLFENFISQAHKLNQPVAGDFTFANLEMMRVAKESGFKKIYYGFGTQMLLGNLGLNRLWHKERLVEFVIPRVVLNFFYKATVRVKGLSVNAEAILTTKDWLHRFFYNQSALFTREQYLYKHLPADFIENTVGFLRPIITNQALNLSDRFVMLYLLSWTNYGQQRHTTALAKLYNLNIFSPFNTPAVAAVIFKTPDVFRKKSQWDKQLWRDVMRPYVSDELYVRKGNSLLVPYTKIFNQDVGVFIDYLDSNVLVRDLIDLKLYRETFSTLPEPGLNLIRLLSLAIWYDAHFDKENLALVKKAFTDFDFDKKMVAHMAPPKEIV